MTLRGTFLWIHVVFGTLWIGSALCFVLAAAVLDSESGERREFAIRAAPVINRIGLVAAVVVITSGLGNIWMAGRLTDFHFRPEFVDLLEGKVLLYGIMAVALYASFRAAAKLSGGIEGEGAMRADAIETGRLARFHLVTALSGALALMLGLWLAGS
ncbi:MAG TPA: hypothetical protein VMD75_01250 [Candidatus Binataceae bacterium]|nr:hypothetical protein [Candidatus Binataceae bacterium]